MSGSATIRPSRPEDLDALDSLFRRRFGHPLGTETRAWKYSGGPGKAVSLVAEDESGEVIAHAGARGLPAEIEGRVSLLWQVADVVASPRRSGLKPPVLDLLRALFQRVPGPQDWPWLFGFPGDRHHRLGERLFGYRILLPVPEMGGILKAAAAGPPLEGTDRAEPWAEAAWRACGTPSVARTLDFLTWRYWSRPDRYYHFYRLEASDAPPGLVVFAFRDDEARAVELWLPGPARSYEGALRSAAADLFAKGSRRWTFWAWPGPMPPDLAASLALVPTATTWTMSVRPRQGQPLPDAAAGVRYCLGDYDVE